MIILRLKRGGKKRNACYRVVAAERAMRRDGRNIEEIGYYHPCVQPAKFEVKADRVKHYLENGATMSPTVARFVKKLGILEQ